MPRVNLKLAEMKGMTTEEAAAAAARAVTEAEAATTAAEEAAREAEAAEPGAQAAQAFAEATMKTMKGRDIPKMVQTVCKVLRFEKSASTPTMGFFLFVCIDDSHLSDDHMREHRSACPRGNT